MRKIACPVVWEGAGAQSPSPDPIDQCRCVVVRKVCGIKGEKLGGGAAAAGEAPLPSSVFQKMDHPSLSNPPYTTRLPSALQAGHRRSEPEVKRVSVSRAISWIQVSVSGPAMVVAISRPSGESIRSW